MKRLVLSLFVILLCSLVMGQQWYAFEGAGLPDAIFEFGTCQGNLVFGGLHYNYEWDGVALKIIGVVDPGGMGAQPSQPALLSLRLPC